MKRALSIAAVVLLAALAAGAMLSSRRQCRRSWSNDLSFSSRRCWRKLGASRASAFGHVDFESNQSSCGPASIANILRSFREPADTERKVLAHTSKCWSGVCFFALSLDELADVTRTATKRNVTVLQDLTPDVVFLQVRRLEAELTRKRKADAAFIGKPRR
jgi:hypothetical protein